jgi:hypothetical protein
MYTQPLSPEKRALLNVEHVVVCLTDPTRLTNASKENQLYSRIAFVQNKCKDTIDLQLLIAWKNKRSARPIELLNLPTKFTTYSIAGAISKKADAKNQKALQLASGSKLKVLTDHTWDVNLTQSAVRNVVTPIKDLGDTSRFGNQQVTIRGRIDSIETVTNNVLVAKLSVSDNSATSVHMCVFKDNEDMLQDVKKGDSFIAMVKIRNVSGLTTVALSQWAINVNDTAQIQVLPPLTKRTSNEVAKLPSLSQDPKQILELLFCRPENMTWFSNQTVLVKRVMGDYVVFLCPACATLLWCHDDDGWQCNDHGAIPDHAIVFKSKPTLEIEVHGKHVDLCYVQEGQEKVLFGKQLQEIVETGEIVSPDGKSFMCTLGVGPKAITLLNLQSA